MYAQMRESIAFCSPSHLQQLLQEIGGSYEPEHGQLSLLFKPLLGKGILAVDLA